MNYYFTTTDPTTDLMTGETFTFVGRDGHHLLLHLFLLLQNVEITFLFLKLDLQDKRTTTTVTLFNILCSPPLPSPPLSSQLTHFNYTSINELSCFERVFSSFLTSSDSKSRFPRSRERFFEGG